MSSPARTDGGRRLGALLLAAGRSRRFGSDKRRATLPDGSAMLTATARRYREVFDEVIVVLRRGDDDADSLLAGLDVGIVRAARADDGMGHSLAAGIAACSEWNAAFVALADMPFVRTDTLARLTALWLSLPRTEGTALRPTFADQAGHPVCFDASLFPLLATAAGDRGGAQALRRAPTQHRVAVSDEGVLTDADTPEALIAPRGRRDGPPHRN